MYAVVLIHNGYIRIKKVPFRQKCEKCKQIHEKMNVSKFLERCEEQIIKQRPLQIHAIFIKIIIKYCYWTS